MTATSPLVLGILLEVEPAIDPNIVRPGWTPLLVTVLLLVALVFLFFSMRKQMRKIRTPDDIEAERRAAQDRVSEDRASEAVAPTQPEAQTEVRSDARSEPRPGPPDPRP